ncbi:MAG: GNAT family N-acetyltransferase [Alphaproteobacteria bacterium]|nr:GNAT family N-acetyltransferase [Alphaproteobacteria bacterium]
MSGITIRNAVVSDVPMLMTMMRELAIYDGIADGLETNEDLLRRDGFGASPQFRAVVAEIAGETAGFVSYFERYSTWKGGMHIAVDDVFVREPFRAKGVGKAMMQNIRGIAVAKGCNLRWEAEVANEKARGFYEKLGAKTRLKRICYWDVAE